MRRPEHGRTRAGTRVRVTSRRVTASMLSPITRTRTKPCLPLKVAAEQNVPLPNRSYIYVIHVDGVLRYIGKGTNGRMYSHMKEVRQRLTRKFKLKNIWPLFQRKLTEAVMKGAVIEEIVLADNLTSKQATSLNIVIWNEWFTRGIASNSGMPFRQASIRRRSTKLTYRNSPKT